MERAAGRPTGGVEIEIKEKPYAHLEETQEDDDEKGHLKSQNLLFVLQDQSREDDCQNYVENDHDEVKWQRPEGDGCEIPVRIFELDISR